MRQFAYLSDRDFAVKTPGLENHVISTNWKLTEWLNRDAQNPKRSQRECQIFWCWNQKNRR